MSTNWKYLFAFYVLLLLSIGRGKAIFFICRAIYTTTLLIISIERSLMDTYILFDY